VVDFENGTVDVEMALPPGERISDDQARKKLEQTLVSAMEMGEDDRPMPQIAKQPVSVPHGPGLLEGQIGDRDGNAAAPGDYRRIAEEAARNAKKKSLKGGDGRTRVVYQADLRLVPDHIRVRAARYKSLVERYSREHRIPVPVVYAVMETESMFNPTARSPAPAFGLMQLVPTSGARDAYRFLYNRDRIVSDTYLYNPENNVRLGSAYLHKLYYDYMDGIDNEESRLLCAIAAYNTGSGNVFRAFAGKYSRARFGSYSKYKQAALRAINRRTPAEVYSHMRRHLPYQETRDYIRKVTERMPKYAA
jgi:membrane-bound lytic murein transglycosylase C